MYSKVSIPVLLALVLAGSMVLHVPETMANQSNSFQFTEDGSDGTDDGQELPVTTVAQSDSDAGNTGGDTTSGGANAAGGGGTRRAVVRQVLVDEGSRATERKTIVAGPSRKLRDFATLTESASPYTRSPSFRASVTTAHADDIPAVSGFEAGNFAGRRTDFLAAIAALPWWHSGFLIVSVVTGNFFWWLLRRWLTSLQTSRRAFPTCRHPARRSSFYVKMGTLLAGIILFFFAARAFAEEFGAHRITFSGTLSDSSGKAITSPVKVRVSWWKSADWVTGDTTSTGAIRMSAPAYGGWFEVHSVTPSSAGKFTLTLGSGTSLPRFDNFTTPLDSLFRQVEVKMATSADTAYELLDPEPSNEKIDRSGLNAVPFAFSATFLGKRGLGTGSGSIPFLLSGGLLPIRTVPGGTHRDAFTIDHDNSVDGNGSIRLRFGDALGKTISFDRLANRFNFNAAVRIQGDLTVTGSLTIGGLINGVDIGSLVGANTNLKVSSGGGLTISIAPGAYRINGKLTNYPGQNGIALSGSGSHYAFFTSTGLVVSLGGYPVDKSFIPLAKVTATNAMVTNVRDDRALSSDDREELITVVYHPEYPNAVYASDDNDDVGQLSLSTDGGSSRNVYRWTSTRAAQQHYDIQVRIPVPVNFVRWQYNPIRLAYRTSSDNALDAKVDVSMIDTTGNPVAFSGSVTNLKGISWTTMQAAFLAGAAWQPGKDFLVKIRLYAKSDAFAEIAELKFLYAQLSAK